MKNILVFIAVGFSSCVSLINGPNVDIDIHTNEPSLVIIDSDTLETTNNKASFYVPRKKAPLEVTSIALSDSLTKSVSVHSKNSLAYLLNTLPLYGLGYLIDHNNPQRFTYPGSVYIDLPDEESDYFVYAFPQKGELYFNFSIPHINSFLLQPLYDSGRKVNSGFWGFTVGLDMCYSNKHYFNLSATIADDFNSPFLPLDIEEERTSFQTSYISLSHNHNIRRFSLGYGLSYGAHLFYNQTIEMTTFGPVLQEETIEYRALGLIFPAYAQISESFFIGFIYRPTYIRYGIAPKLKYEHLMSLSFAWRFRLLK